MKNQIRKTKIFKQLYKIKESIRNYFELNNQAKLLNHACYNLSGDFDKLLRNLKLFNSFTPSQKDSELHFLFDLIEENKFETICEIGSYKGGSLFIFCQAGQKNAKIISIDIDYPWKRLHAHKNFVKENQKLICFRGDTKNPKTVKKTIIALKNRPIDFLFIDGDHSSFGVMNDFVRFSPLVREGGVIAFHDINPTDVTEEKNNPDMDVGGVPKFWQFIKASGYTTEEYISEQGQKGFGLGILYK